MLTKRIIRAEGSDWVRAEGKFIRTQMQADSADERGLVPSICSRPVHLCQIFASNWPNEFQKKLNRGWQAASSSGFI
jgi:hypothetical protein